MGLRASFAALDETAIWRDDEVLECTGVIPEAPNVATFSFSAPSGAWFRYEPGQFLTLELPVPGETVWRTYTISSSPSRPPSISATLLAYHARQSPDRKELRLKDFSGKEVRLVMRDIALELASRRPGTTSGV